VFLALAAGSILYVVIQLLGVAQKAGCKDLLYWGVLAGLAVGFLTDMVVTAEAHEIDSSVGRVRAW
jgi:ZIP family zinc transporter